MEYKTSEQRSTGKSEKRKTLRISGFIFILVLLGIAFGLGYATAIRVAPPQPYTSRYTLETSELQHITGFNAKLYSLVYGMIKDAYIDKERLNDDKLFYGALQGMVDAVGDPYTVFLDPSTYQEFDEELAGTFEGIGAEIGIQEDRLTVIAPLADSPAERAGLRSGDIILAIDDSETIGMKLDEAITLIRGERGTQVKLIIFRKDNEETTEEITITRDTIVVPTVRWKVEDQIAVINIYSFNSEVHKQFAQALVELNAVPLQGIIIDLRNNPGGFLDRAVTVASAWVQESDIVVREIFRDPALNEEHRAIRHVRAPLIPTAVLVNKGSASASEILAGALQDYKFATVIGMKTYGKGSVQDLRQLPDGSGLKITIAQWLTPKGRLINDNGIAPDIEVDLTRDDYLHDRDPQLDAAKKFIKENQT